MTVQQDGTVSVQEVVEMIQRHSNKGAARGRLGNKDVTIPTCYNSSQKGSDDRMVVMSLNARGCSPKGWTGNEREISVDPHEGYYILRSPIEDDPLRVDHC
jgi:hypothetical protein